MMGICSECGASEYFATEHQWLNNGDIVIKTSPENRLIFIESGNIDPLINGMEQIIGVPLEKLVMATFRKSVRTYLENLLPDNVHEMVRTGQIDPKALDDVLGDVGRVTGVGNYQFVDMRNEGDKDDFFTVSISEPYSVPMCAASHAGAIEAIFGYDHEVTYSWLGPDFYSMTAIPAEHPEELEARMPLDRYEHREGDIELERCETCGGPKGLSEYQWFIDRGVILNKTSKHRMELLGPNELTPVFKELEEELGDTVPQVIVESQRRFTKTGFYSPDEVKNEEEFRNRLALKGLGNLRSLKMSKQGLSMRLDNATMHLLIVGIMQGIFDMAFDVDSTADWEYSDEGNLEIEVKPKT